MKKLALALLLLPFIVFAQQKKITFDEIYRTNIFAAEAVPGFHSMNDGRFFIDYAVKNLLKMIL